MIAGVVTDSRQVLPGHLFVALRGARVDGHNFLHQAAERGAVAAVVAADYAGPDFGLRLERVDDPLSHLQEMARNRVAALKCRIVGITGSMGKTTTKEFLATLVRQRWRTFATAGNQNSQVGLPLSLLTTRGDEQVLVLEMAMTESGQIRRLTELAPPHLAVITNVHYRHSENFASLEGIQAAKAEIFSQERTRVRLMPHGFGVSGRTFSFEQRDADYFGRFEGRRLSIYEGGELAAELDWHLPGLHLARNFLPAAAAARELGLSWNEILAAVPQLALPERRFALVQRGGVTIVNDTYNNGSEALIAAARELPEGKRRIGFVSEMTELGAFSERLHAEVGQALLSHLDHLYCIGPATAAWSEIWRAAGKTCTHVVDREALLQAARDEVREGDVLLFKGARSYALEEIVAQLLDSL